MQNDEQENENLQTFVEGVHYYFDEGRLVMTAKYLLDRGYCCGNGCLNCPFEAEAEAVAAL